jgi:Domain of unknown function (DUF4157)
MGRQTATKASTNTTAECADQRSQAHASQYVPSGPHTDVLALQRSAGNRAVTQVLEAEGSNRPSPGNVHEDIQTLGNKRLRPLLSANASYVDAEFAGMRKRNDLAHEAPALSGVVQRKCACGDHPMAGGECQECSKKKRFGLQTKLKVNEPGDIYEQEADRIANQVMAIPAHPAVSGAPLRIQRFSEQSNGRMDGVPASVDQALAGPGRPLEPALRQDMEQRFGYDFSGVRVHTGAATEKSAREVNAHAYTAGQDIVFDKGLFAPGTQEGRRLIAHELTHVVQQRGSSARIQRAPTPRPATPDPDAERAAAVAEAEALLARDTEQEEAFALDGRKRNDKRYAWSLGRQDKARIQENGIKTGELSRELQYEVTVKIRFFEGEAKRAYLQTIGPALAEFLEQSVEILAEASGGQTTQKLTCDDPKSPFLLEYEGEPAKARCTNVTTDPEFNEGLFDRHISSAVGVAVEGTTWANVEYDRFKVMLVKYRNGSSEYFMLDDIGNFRYGGGSSVHLVDKFLKRKNGLLYPVYNGRITFSEVLTPNIIKYKNRLKYQIIEMRDLYDLLQVGGMFASIVGSYGAVSGTPKSGYRSSLQGFRRIKSSPTTKSQVSSMAITTTPAKTPTNPTPQKQLPPGPPTATNKGRSPTVRPGGGRAKYRRPPPPKSKLGIRGGGRGARPTGPPRKRRGGGSGEETPPGGTIVSPHAPDIGDMPTEIRRLPLRPGEKKPQTYLRPGEEKKVTSGGLVTQSGRAPRPVGPRETVGGEIGEAQAGRPVPPQPAPARQPAPPPRPTASRDTRYAERLRLDEGFRQRELTRLRRRGETRKSLLESAAEYERRYFEENGGQDALTVRDVYIYLAGLI